MKHLFVFNPDCELAIANGGKFYTAPANIVQMTKDLAFLPAFLGGSGDYVLMKDLPDKEFLMSVAEPLNVQVRAVIEKEIMNLDGLQGAPWGNSPKMCHWLAQKGLGEEWKPERKEWYSRKVAREGLKLLLQVLHFVEADTLPVICNSLEEIEQRVQDGDYLVKAPWSSSGKGILMLHGQLQAKEKEWLRGMMRRQGYLMLEKKLNKVQDFAMEFYAGESGIEFLGWSVFTTGEHGEYHGNYIGSQENIEILLKEQLGSHIVNEIKQALPVMLEGLLPLYRGYLGIDMLIYQDDNGELRVQPCIEINLRYNMGIVALLLSRNYVAEGIVGEFTIDFYPDKGEAMEQYRYLRQSYPVKYKNNRIMSGYLSLTPVTASTHFVASVRCY